MERTERLVKIGGVLVFAASVAFVWYAVFTYQARANPRMTFFDVGQGDAIFLEMPNGNQVLIDGGPGGRVLARLGRAMPFWDRSIDVIVLTHPHLDHVEGLIDVLKRYRVGMVVTSGAEYKTPEFEEWQKIIREKNIPLHIARAGERINLGGGGVLDIFLPFTDFSGNSPKEIHDAMVAAKFSFGENSVLLMGDAEREFEYKLVFFGFPVDSDILKVGHHGSRTSSAEEFVRAVSPDISVIEVGKKNRYGHPHEETIGTISRFGGRIMRTDESGDIRVFFTETGMRIIP